MLELNVPSPGKFLLKLVRRIISSFFATHDFRHDTAASVRRAGLSTPQERAARGSSRKETPCAELGYSERQAGGASFAFRKRSQGSLRGSRNKRCDTAGNAGIV